MKFELKNVITEHYLENFKPFQLRTMVVSESGYDAGYSDPFLSMIDNGAKLTSISSKRMKLILPKIRDKHGSPLQPVGTVTSMGVYGKARQSPLYILPHLYLDRMHFTDVLVHVPETENYDCLIGRSILHQCVATYNPKLDSMIFDFEEDMKGTKQQLAGFSVFGDVHQYAEFSADG